MATEMTDQDLRAPTLAAGVLGFALGGFIDGILLHQVLQWHHLLSLVEGEGFRDIKVQILADGLFHVLMYGIALLGLWMLWRGRAGISGRPGDLRIVAAALLGFSLWQFVDVVGFHWLIGIHRIRVDVPDPLIWDVGWLVVFGGPSLAGGLWLWRRSPPDPGAAGPRSGLRAGSAALAALVIAAGPVSALPPPGVTTALVVFRPGVTGPDAFAAAAQADVRVLWASRSGDVLAVDFGATGDPGALYRNGAVLVSTSAILAGCFAWARG